MLGKIYDEEILRRSKDHLLTNVALTQYSLLCWQIKANVTTHNLKQNKQNHRCEHNIWKRVRCNCKFTNLVSGGGTERAKNIERGSVMNRSEGLEMNGSRSGIHLFGANYHCH